MLHCVTSHTFALTKLPFRPGLSLQALSREPESGLKADPGSGFRHGDSIFICQSHISSPTSMRKRQTSITPRPFRGYFPSRLVQQSRRRCGAKKNAFGLLPIIFNSFYQIRRNPVRSELSLPSLQTYRIKININTLQPSLSNPASVAWQLP